MVIINLTPHEINVYNSSNELVISLPPSGTVARVAQVTAPVDATTHGAWTDAAGERGIALSAPTFGAVEGLPAETPGVVFIVSALVRTAAPKRMDIASPGTPLRNEAGQPIGCVGLFVNVALPTLETLTFTVPLIAVDAIKRAVTFANPEATVRFGDWDMPDDDGIAGFSPGLEVIQISR